MEIDFNKNNSKIAVIGCPGSGKTTFAKELSKKTNIPHISLDDLYWHDNWARTDETEWLDVQKRITAGSSWIIDGNYFPSIDIRLEAANIIIYVEQPTLVCISRVLRREITRAAGCKSNLPKNVKYKGRFNFRFNIKFYIKVLTFNKKYKPEIFYKLDNLSLGKQVYQYVRGYLRTFP